MLSCSSSLGRNNSPDCGCEGFGPMGFFGGICKKTGIGKTIPCKSRAHQSAEPRLRSRDCALFRADYLLKTSIDPDKTWHKAPGYAAPLHFEKPMHDPDPSDVVCLQCQMQLT